MRRFSYGVLRTAPPLKLSGSHAAARVAIGPSGGALWSQGVVGRGGDGDDVFTTQSMP